MKKLFLMILVSASAFLFVGQQTGLTAENTSLNQLLQLGKLFEDNLVSPEIYSRRVNQILDAALAQGSDKDGLKLLKLYFDQHAISKDIYENRVNLILDEVLSAPKPGTPPQPPPADLVKTTPMPEGQAAPAEKQPDQTAAVDPVGEKPGVGDQPTLPDAKETSPDQALPKSFDWNAIPVLFDISNIGRGFYKEKNLLDEWQVFKAITFDIQARDTLHLKKEMFSADLLDAEGAHYRTGLRVVFEHKYRLSTWKAGDPGKGYILLPSEANFDIEIVNKLKILRNK